MPVYAENFVGADRYDHSILLTTALGIVAVALIALIL